MPRSSRRATAAIFAERLTAQGLAGSAAARPRRGRRAPARRPGPGPARRAARGPRAHRGPDRRRRRPGAERGALAADHLAQPRHPAPGAQRGLPLAARADHAAAAHLSHAPPRAGGRLRRGRRAGDDDDRAGARRRGPADPPPAARAARRGRRADRGPGADPPALPGDPARASPSAARWSASSTPTSSSATGSGRRKPVDRDAALAELARRYLVGHAPADDRDLAQAGPGCRCATPAPAWRRSPRSWSSARTASSTSPAAAGRRGPAAAPARRLRPGPARLDLARADPRPPHAAGHHQRHLPPLRDGRRSRRRHLEAQPAARSRSSRSAASPRRRAPPLDADAADVERFMAAA